MPDVIHLLPDSIANQIAAEEVVQRPASVVKELMENSIDAGATDIKVILRDAGKSYIQVIDNGTGMSETDARMSLERHATSKIRSVDDLLSLRTMGFRGEALASISAIAQVEIKTRLADRDTGTRILTEGSKVKLQETAVFQKGSSITVKNLFYNVPARRQFLKSNAREFDHIFQEFVRIVLAHSEIAASLHHNEDTICNLLPAPLSRRIVSVLGKGYQNQLVPCQENTSWLQVTGYVGKPESARKKRGDQFLFVNNRFVRSNYLHHGILQAYEHLLSPGTHPFYVIFLTIDPKYINVNIHPTKTEVKFNDERGVYGIVWSTVKQGLGAHNLTAPLDFSSNVNLMTTVIGKEKSTDPVISSPRLSVSHRDLDQNLPWSIPPIKDSSTAPIPSGLNDLSEPPIKKGTVFFQWKNKYIIMGMKEDLLIVDQQLAHERILFEKYVHAFSAPKRVSQQLLFPQTVTFSASDYGLLMEMKKELSVLGFQFEAFGDHTVLITGVPPELEGQEQGVLEGLIDQFKLHQAKLDLPHRDNVTRSLARRTCIKEGKTLLPEEMESIIGSLFTCQTPQYAPDGRPIFFILQSSQLEKHFTS